MFDAFIWINCWSPEAVPSTAVCSFSIGIAETNVNVVTKMVQLKLTFNLELCPLFECNLLSFLLRKITYVISSFSLVIGPR